LMLALSRTTNFQFSIPWTPCSHPLMDKKHAEMLSRMYSEFWTGHTLLQGGSTDLQKLCDIRIK
jgi:hypothetical protein